MIDIVKLIYIHLSICSTHFRIIYSYEDNIEKFFEFNTKMAAKKVFKSLIQLRNNLVKSRLLDKFDTMAVSINQ
jgi:hypothetical protein